MNELSNIQFFQYIKLKKRKSSTKKNGTVKERFAEKQARIKERAAKINDKLKQLNV